jgi:hypothetical protein
MVGLRDCEAIVEILGHRFDQSVCSIGPIEVTKVGVVPGLLWIEIVSFIELEWRRDVCPDRVGHACLQFLIFRCRHWRRRRQNGKDEGNEREEHPGELIHRDVQVCKGRKVVRVVLGEQRTGFD